MNGPLTLHAMPLHPAAWNRWLVVLTLLPACLLGCGRAQPPSYQDSEGFHLTPPPGWSERARPAAAPGAEARPRGEANMPLPSVGTLGARTERLLVRYDRPSAGRQAWLRVTAADIPSSQSLEARLSGGPPNPGWRLEAQPEALQVSGLPAARIAFSGRWDKKPYLNETVAVRKGDRVYFITASFPAGDATAREQVRQAVASVSWR